MRQKLETLGAYLTTLLAGLVSAACGSFFGPDKVVSTHTGYNDAVQLTVTREVLANVVRSRYSDPMQFLSVSTINAQFSVSVGGTGSAGGLGGVGATGEVAGSVGYSDSPTITYVPQSGSGFYNSLLSPFGVDEVIGFGLTYRFARQDLAWEKLGLQFSFAAINGADDFISGRYNELYGRRIDAIARLLQLGAIYRQVPEWDFNTSNIPKDKVLAEDMVAAFKEGLYFVEEDDGQSVRLARYRLVLGLVLPDAEDPEMTAALAELGVAPGRSQYVFRPPTHSRPGIHDPHAVWVTTRSMIDVISLAAHLVEVPAEHAEIVPALDPEATDSVALPSLHIRSSESEPPFPYRIQHRGYWFYVDDSEIESKVFLESIVAAYSSRLGWKQAGDAPQLVLPVGS